MRRTLGLALLPLLGLGPGNEMGTGPFPSGQDLPASVAHPPIPGGGRILYFPTDNFWSVGVLESDGTTSEIRVGPNQHYWDPAHPGAVLIKGLRDRGLIRSYGVADGRWRRLGQRRLDTFSAEVSFDGRRIAFTPVDPSGSPKNGKVRLLDRMTGRVAALPSAEFDRVGWSPDGRFLVTRSDARGAWHGAWLWSLDTGRRDLLIRRSALLEAGLPGPHRVSLALDEVTWSSDARLLALPLRWGPRGHGVLVATSRGGILDLIETGPRFVSIPTWSPDRAVFAYVARGDGRNGHRQAALHVYDVMARRETIIAEPVSDAFWASWSPDGEWLLVDDSTRDRWLFVSRDGSEEVSYEHLGHQPRWCCPSSPPINISSPLC